MSTQSAPDLTHQSVGAGTSDIWPDIFLFSNEPMAPNFEYKKIYRVNMLSILHWPA